MTKSCNTCQTAFEISDEDLAFYDRVSPVFAGKKYLIPPPTLCPMCRLRRRLVFRNHTAIFQRPAHPDGKMIFSMYPENTKFPVMRNEEHFSDSWDPLDYGRDFDFSRPFFEQFQELSNVVPRYARIGIRNENSDYCNNVSDNKNLYLCFSISNAEDCMYCESAWDSKDCIECTLTLQSERCYDCTYCLRCYNLQSSEYSENCSDSYFLAFCRNCKDCFGCVNLRNKQYCIWNEQKTKEEYQVFMRGWNDSSWREREKVRQQFEEFTKGHPRPHATLHQVENCSGNFIAESRNVIESSYIQLGENLKYCFNLYDGINHNSMDWSFFGRKGELMYECCSCGININQLAFCVQGRDGSSNLLYCVACDSSEYCFGCISLKKKKYCILNKQYAKEEYEELVPKIIELMRRTDEWGQFFPMQLCPIPYNRSLAQRYFPLAKEEALQQGFTWHEEDPREFPGAIEATALPDGLPEGSGPIIVKSALSGRPFRIIPQEIDAYRKFKVPLPRLTYEERMDERAKKLGGIKLYERNCAKTGKPILTTYPPDSPYIIWDREEHEGEFN